MAEAIVVILVFIAIIAFAALAFAGWVIVSVISIGWSLLQWIFGKSRSSPAPGPVQRRPMPVLAAESTICRNPLCVAANPPGAHFCRRCGQRQPKPLPVTVRRAAAW